MQKKIETFPLTGHKLQYISSWSKNVNKSYKKDGKWPPFICPVERVKFSTFLKENPCKHIHI